MVVRWTVREVIFNLSDSSEPIDGLQEAYNGSRLVPHSCVNASRFAYPSLSGREPVQRPIGTSSCCIESL